MYPSVRSEPKQSLTDFELRLLSLIAAGHGVRRVARVLSISESTLRRRMVTIQRKLGANSRINSVYVAAKKGLI